MRLEDVADFRSGGTPSKARADYWDGHIPWVSAKDMKESRLRDTEDHISTAGLEHGTQIAPPAATLVLTRGMTLLNEVPICALEREVAFNQDVKAVIPRDELNPSYMTYALLAARPLLLSMVELAGHGTGRLPTDQLRALPIPLPPKAEQREIAAILGALDDKIELNRRMNETLEAIARAIFKSWFVDFDPVRAKAEGRKPFGTDAETAALFPDSFEDSPLGEIPKGWRALPLPEAVCVNPPRPLAKGQKATYLDMQSIPTRGPRPSSWILRPFGSGSRFKNGDTLVARITPCLENGKTAYIDLLDEGEVGWGSTEFIVFRPKGPLPPEFGYCLARDEDFRQHAIQNMIGSSGRQRVPTECFSQFWVAVPSDCVAQIFGQVVNPLFDGIRANSEESSTLTTLRDTLLPKLISGQVRVGPPTGGHREVR